MREVEIISFIPLVFCAFVGMGVVATITFRQSASLIAAHRDQPFSAVMV